MQPRDGIFHISDLGCRDSGKNEEIFWPNIHRMDIYVCVDVPSDNPVLWVNYLLHAWQVMNAHHSVCVEVLLEQSATWIIHYTCQKQMDTLQYVCVGVPSDYFALGMTYYTCQKKNAHFPLCALMYIQIILLREWLITYITGKWTHSTMCALMYLQITPSRNDLLHASQINAHSSLCAHWCILRLLCHVKDS